MGYAEFAGYSIKSAIEFMQFKDSTDICHRFHPNAHLSEYLKGGFHFRSCQKRIGVT
jgi:hypothetical protein